MITVYVVHRGWSGVYVCRKQIPDERYFKSRDAFMVNSNLTFLSKELEFVPTNQTPIYYFNTRREAIGQLKKAVPNLKRKDHIAKKTGRDYVFLP